ncbi:MAG: helix-hairpin-helix domain-containing protein [Actinomycetota bacterium]|nr:helix-hairpin-helix domain-containing protein [Actinomycetota bacterium]
MQASSILSRIKVFFSDIAENAKSLSRFQLAIIVLICVLLVAGSAFGYLRSKPKAITVAEKPTGKKESVRMLAVHVAGAVLNPGLYRVPSGSRVADVLTKAGGALPDARIDSVNLAERVKDGQKVMVPSASTAAPLQNGSLPAGGQESTGLVNINLAGAEELDKLPGIGPTLSQRIVECREKNGPFTSVDELKNVEGIGPKKFQSIKDLVTI